MNTYLTDHVEHHLINDLNSVNVQHEEHDVPLLKDVSAKIPL